LVFALRDQQNQLDNLNLTRENLRTVEAQIAVGTKAPLERAEVQTELANRESTLLLAVQTVSIAENSLKNLIVKDSTAGEWSSQITPTDTPKFDAAPVNLNDALKEARDNRPELRRLRLQSDINAIDLQYFKNQMRPQIDLQATFATTGLAGSPCTGSACQGSAPAFLQGGFAQDLRNVFSFETRTIVVGMTFQFPIQNTTAKANFAGASIQKEQLQASVRSQDQLIEQDVRNAAQNVETSRRRVLAARDARVNAETQLEGEQRLYQVGRSTTFLLFQRQNALTNARNAELRAETDYNKALADLQRATSTTLRANNVMVDAPTP
jgi:HAE1 family hydrophobic/amphiphilic exporter-1